MANRTYFETFLEGWIVRQQNFLDELIFLSTEINGRESDQRDLIARVISRYREYFEENSRSAAQEDVFVILSPPWLTNFERIFLWIGGLKMSLSFRLVTRSVVDLSADQVERMEMLKEETKAMESEMVKVQERVAMPTMVEIVRRRERSVDLEREIEMVREGMVMLVRNADIVRGTTLREILEILHPVQGLRFLTAFAQFQFLIRRWGLQRDADT